MSQTAGTFEALLCRACSIPLGSTDRRRLWLGPCVLSRTVTLECAGCGACQHWSPDPPGYSERRLRRDQLTGVVQS